MPSNEAQDARLKELLGLITQGEWEAGRPKSNGIVLYDSSIKTIAYFLPFGNAKHTKWSEKKIEQDEQSKTDAEFIALVRNRIGPLLQDLDYHAQSRIHEREARHQQERKYQELEEAFEQAQAEVARLREAAEMLVATVHLIPFVPKGYKSTLSGACRVVEQALSPAPEARDEAGN